ncbi:hypothetical protein N9X05_13010 [Paracoccaceae bacterium]|nr:hypothetical protein [Paracoccaceae bacterium]
MSEAKTKRNSPRRILEIIEAICLNPESATASGLSQSLNIPAPTIYRWLEALCEERFIAAHASGYYVPGERFRSLTLGSLQHEPGVTVRRSILRKLSEQINETVSLAVPHGTKLIYFDRLDSHWPFQVNLKVGEELPLHCCASGKLYLSTLPIDQAMGIFGRIIRKPLRAIRSFLGPCLNGHCSKFERLVLRLMIRNGSTTWSERRYQFSTKVELLPAVYRRTLCLRGSLYLSCEKKFL